MQGGGYYSAEEIQAKVKNLAADAGVPLAPPCRLEFLVAHLGYEIVEFQSDESVANVVGAVAHKKRKIYVDVGQRATSIVFVVARLIGHVVLYGGASGEFAIYGCGESVSRPEAVFSRCFAMELLMPEAHFAKSMCREHLVPWRVAPIYGVSAEAVEARARQLDLPVRDPFKDREWRTQ